MLMVDALSTPPVAGDERLRLMNAGAIRHVTPSPPARTA
jgi:hypothetical protein